MLIEFQVENYLSFKEKTTLSMAAAPLKELKEAVIEIDKYKLLRSAAVFGANASGKSNLMKAISFMKNFVLESAKESTFGKEIQVYNFRLSEETLNKPSTFEMTFIVKDDLELSKTGNIVYRYGFQLNREMVKSEWLFGRFTAQESTLFTRSGDEIYIGEKFKEAKQVYKVLGKINKTSLFISQIAAIKGENAPQTNSIFKYFNKLHDITSISDTKHVDFTINIMKYDFFREKVIKALSLADFSIEDIIVSKEDHQSNIQAEDSLNNFINSNIYSLHNVYDQSNKIINKTKFKFMEEESDGSKKFLAIIGPIIGALEMGLMLVVDELDARLHPNLCLLIISLFNSKKTNPKGAQLIFATHNTLMMDKRFLRRDQIYLVEKDQYGASELYSLVDYKSVRNDASYNKDYLMGKYGAVPYLGNFESLLTEEK